MRPTLSQRAGASRLTSARSTVMVMEDRDEELLTSVRGRRSIRHIQETVKPKSWEEMLPSPTVAISTLACCLCLALWIILGICSRSDSSGEIHLVVRDYLKRFQEDAPLAPIAGHFVLKLKCCCPKDGLQDYSHLPAADSPCIIQDEECPVSTVRVYDRKYNCHWPEPNYTLGLTPVMLKQTEVKHLHLFLTDSLNWQPFLAVWGFPVLERYLVIRPDEVPQSEADMQGLLDQALQAREASISRAKAGKHRLCSETSSRRASSSDSDVSVSLADSDEDQEPKPKPLFFVKPNHGKLRDSRQVFTDAMNASVILPYVQEAMDAPPRNNESWTFRRVRRAVVFEEVYDFTDHSMRLCIQTMFGKWVMAVAANILSEDQEARYWVINSKGKSEPSGDRNFDTFAMSSCEVDRTGCSVKTTVELLLPECIVHAEAIAGLLRIPWLRVDFFIMGTQGVKINRLSYASHMVMPYVDRHIGDVYAQAWLQEDSPFPVWDDFNFLETVNCDLFLPAGKDVDVGWMTCKGSDEPRLPPCTETETERAKPPKNAHNEELIAVLDSDSRGPVSWLYRLGHDLGRRLGFFDSDSFFSSGPV